jgi:hypothetical protein
MTQQENIVSVTLNGPVDIQRQQHITARIATTDRFRKNPELSGRVCVVPVPVCCGSVNRPATQHRQSVSAPYRIHECLTTDRACKCKSTSVRPESS